jgi:hypothetical protein
MQRALRLALRSVTVMARKCGRGKMHGDNPFQKVCMCVCGGGGGGWSRPVNWRHVSPLNVMVFSHDLLGQNV